MISQKHKQLPHIAQRTNARLKQLGLTPKITPEAFIKKHNGNKHRYTSICTDVDGNRVSFYARLHDNKDAKKKFQTEIAYFRAFSKSKSILSRHVPKLFDSSVSAHGEWCVREYIDLPPLGNEYEVEKTATIKNTKQFVELFKELQKIPKMTSPETRNADFFTQIAEGNLYMTQKMFQSSDRKRIAQTLHTSYAIIARNTHTLVHGDSHAGNLLYKKEQLYLIDWETVHYNLRTTDLAYFYAGLKLHPSFRKKLLADYEKGITWGGEFKELFPLSVLFFSLNHVYMLIKNKPSALTKLERAEAVRYAVMLANASTKGYTALKKI